MVNIYLPEESRSVHFKQKVAVFSNFSLGGKDRTGLLRWPDKELPNLEIPARESGWVRIARVNSEQFFHVKQLDNRPSQQACSIFASKGEIGEYRYLLLEVNGPTFFGEIDVYQSE